jgi:acetyltransferase-like isoleucine patch superfamily enzyme
MTMRRLAKRAGDLIAQALISPAAVTCWIEASLSEHGETVFSSWAQLMALVPGPAGLFLRRAFYRRTLESCSSSFYVGFGSIFTHRYAVVEKGAYVGPYALIGSAHLGADCLIGSRASLLSGTSLHTFHEGRWLPADISRRQQVQIGANAWIGEGAIVSADVGSGALVAAGAVVTARVPPGIVVAGNPARFVRRLSPEPELQATETDPS